MSIVDCDLHEKLASTGELVPYLDDVWRDFRPQIPQDPYRWPGGTPHRGLPYEELVRGDVALAVLTGATWPGTAFTQVEYHLALTTAYNRWLADEWLSRDERLLGSIQVAPCRPEWSAGEVERCASDCRFVQVVLPATGEDFLGLPRYRPIFEAAARHGLVVALRHAPSSRTATGFPPTYTEWRAGIAQTFMTQVMNLIVSGLFDEHPSLRVLVLEAGFAWVPYLMWTMDANYRALRAEVPWLERKPSEYLMSNVLVGTHPLPLDAPVEQIIDMTGSDEWLVYASCYPNVGHDGPLDMPELARNAKRLYGR